MNLTDWEPLPGLTRRETLERGGVLHALRRTRAFTRGNYANKAAAAKWLGITPSTLYMRLARFRQKGHPIEVRTGARGRVTPAGKAQEKLHMLLARLGIMLEKGRKYIWRLPDEDIQEILDAANKARLRLARLHFPDHGGDPAKAAEVNDTWRKVRKIFRQRGFDPS